MTIQLPQELIEVIIDHLADDSTSLKACSLVCRAWVCRSRRHLYKHITLLVRNILALRELLQSPWCTLLPHVSSIEAIRHEEDPDDGGFDDVAVDLHRLVETRRLNVKLNIRRIRPTPSDPPKFVRAGGFLTAFPNVTNLVLGSNKGQQLMSLIEIIRLFPALQELDVRQLSGTFLEHTVDAVPPLGLRSVRLSRDSVRTVLVWLQAFNRLHNVDSLSLASVKLPLDPTVRTALKQLGGSLRHLDLDVLVRPFASALDLSLYLELKEISIRSKIH
ncbi:hypothetical protein MVEN_00427600 [Mycena venus]|uniref:F-box domain-containing protein n=1 Tax=Mycena venus TaxID=2733690 RepID=A0A8H6YSM0_9AGAR|nr:hypothetical protein MVEN_00427600 [Mycena venus]